MKVLFYIMHNKFKINRHCAENVIQFLRVFIWALLRRLKTQERAW